MPILPWSVGCLPTFFPQWSFGHRPVQGSPLPINTLQNLIDSQAPRPEDQDDPGRRPFLDAAVRRTTGTKARVLERIQLTPGSMDEDDGLHGPAIIDAGPVAPQPVRLSRRPQRLDALPQRVGEPPITSHVLWLITHGSASSGRKVFLHKIPPIEPIGIGSKACRYSPGGTESLTASNRRRAVAFLCGRSSSRTSDLSEAIQTCKAPKNERVN